MRAVVAVLFALGAASACGPSNQPTGLDDPDVRSKLRMLALAASQANGVPSPKSIEAVASDDHQAAEKVVSGSVVNDHVPVYVVEVTGGTFTDSTASVPPGAATPTGTVMTLTVGTQSFNVLDFGLSYMAPDLSQLGPVVS
ncbi:MAG: hypothetical protein ACREOE_19145, partial [Gemmatimonadales bacterium]